jgi:hypothetical protein
MDMGVVTRLSESFKFRELHGYSKKSSSSLPENNIKETLPLTKQHLLQHQE